MLTILRNFGVIRRKYHARLATTLLCAVVILAACGSDSGSRTEDEGHRFVSEQQPATEVTATDAVPTATVSSQPTTVPTVSPDELLIVRGAPQFIYLTIDGELRAYDANERSFTPIELPDGFAPQDYSASPTGDRVGVLGIHEEKYEVIFFGADGQPLSDPIALRGTIRPQPVASPDATPMASPASSVSSVSSVSSELNISWIPQGNAVLISGPGVLQRVSMNGTTMPVSRIGATGTVVNAIWSPMDSQVVLQTQLMSGEQSVFVTNSGSDDVIELEMLSDSSGPSITNLQWLPTGLGLVMVAGEVNNGVVMNGQVYLYQFGEPVPTLIATSGQGGPAATISHVVVSPDGHSVAYAIMVRDLGEWHLHSVWVKPISGGPGVSVPISNTTPITAMAWSSEGLVWQQSNGSISVVDGNLQPRPLGEAPVATPAASPVASPVTSPMASPVATPIVEPTPRG